jgi:hypothetical protein
MIRLFIRERIKERIKNRYPHFYARLTGEYPLVRKLLLSDNRHWPKQKLRGNFSEFEKVPNASRKL